jgi:hypothetical protein
LPEILATIIIAAILLIWAVFSVLLFRAILLDLQSRQWPTITGKIIISSVEPIQTGARRTYKERLLYEYVVDNVTYQANTISFPDHLVRFFLNGGRSKKNAESIKNKYPVGNAVTVHYDPNNPSRATLESGLNDINFILITAITVILGCMFLIVLWNQMIPST